MHPRPQKPHRFLSKTCAYLPVSCNAAKALSRELRLEKKVQPENLVKSEKTVDNSVNN